MAEMPPPIAEALRRRMFFSTAMVLAERELERLGFSPEEAKAAIDGKINGRTEAIAQKITEYVRKGWSLEAEKACKILGVPFSTAKLWIKKGVEGSLEDMHKHSSAKNDPATTNAVAAVITALHFFPDLKKDKYLMPEIKVSAYGLSERGEKKLLRMLAPHIGMSPISIERGLDKMKSQLRAGNPTNKHERIKSN